MCGFRAGVQRHALDDLHLEARQAGDLARVVGEQLELADAEVVEDLRTDAVVAQVGGKAEPLVGLDGVGVVLVLQRVGADLVEQADAAALLAQVDQHAAALGSDRRERGIALGAAVAAQRVERVAGEALGVHPHQHRRAVVDRRPWSARRARCSRARP